MRILIIISCLGVILSISAAVYAATQYLALSHSTNAIEALTPSEDIIAPKIAAMLEDHKSKDLILNELKARQEHGASLHAAIVKMVADSKVRALSDALLWVGVSVIFAMLLVKLGAFLRLKSGSS